MDSNRPGAYATLAVRGGAADNAHDATLQAELITYRLATLRSLRDAGGTRVRERSVRPSPNMSASKRLARSTTLTAPANLCNFLSLTQGCAAKRTFPFPLHCAMFGPCEKAGNVFRPVGPGTCWDVSPGSETPEIHPRAADNAVLPRVWTFVRRALAPRTSHIKAGSCRQPTCGPHMRCRSCSHWCATMSATKMEHTKPAAPRSGIRSFRAVGGCRCPCASKSTTATLKLSGLFETWTCDTRSADNTRCTLSLTSASPPDSALSLRLAVGWPHMTHSRWEAALNPGNGRTACAITQG